VRFVYPSCKTYFNERQSLMAAIKAFFLAAARFVRELPARIASVRKAVVPVATSILAAGALLFGANPTWTAIAAVIVTVIGVHQVPNAQ